MLRSFAIVAAIIVIGRYVWLPMQAPSGHSDATPPIRQKSAASGVEVPPPTPSVTPPNAEQLSQEGWQLWQSQRFSEALPKFREAVEFAPDSVAAWNGLGWAALNSGNADEGGKAFEKVLELAPNHPAALNGLGQVYLAQRDYAKAEPMLLNAAANNASASWYGLTRIYLLRGQFAEAEKWAQMLVDSRRSDGLGQRMLEAAKAKTLSAGLRIDIEPPAPTPLKNQTSPHPKIAP